MADKFEFIDITDSYTNKIVINIVSSTILFLCVSSSSFTSLSLGCQVQKLLRENVFANHILGIICLFFFVTIITPLNYVKDGKVIKENTNSMIKRTLIIYLLYILISKTNWKISTLLLFGLIIIYFLSLINRDYYNEKNTNILKAQSYLANFLAVVLVVGFGMHFNKKYSEYSKTKQGFSFMKFLLGTGKCKSIKL